MTIEPETWQFTFGRRGVLRGAPGAERGHRLVRQRAARPRSAGQERASTSLETWQTWLAALFDGDAGPAAALIRAGQLELAGDNTYDLGHVPVWHRDRMIVIGDAAHAPAPSSGQGASMAMEDGVAARRWRCGTRHRSMPAFAAFEAARRERVERIVAYGARSSSSKTPGRLGSLFRDAFMRVRSAT